MDMQKLAEEIIEGKRLTRKDDLSFFLDCDLDDLCKGADKIREHFVGDKVDLCSIINGRSGRCPEDCKYCAQSAMSFYLLRRDWRSSEDSPLINCASLWQELRKLSKNIT